MIATKVLLLIALLATAALASEHVCHNITGTCLSHGFVCANSEVVKHSQRCDGVEDCADGTDELLCEHEDHTPLHERSHEARHAFAQASCVNCNCEKNAQTVVTGNPWFKFGLAAPTDPLGLMTGSATNYGGAPCNEKCTTGITIAFYKKNKVCRGYLCCIRQRACTACSTAAPCPSVSHPDFNNRCYR